MISAMRSVLVGVSDLEGSLSLFRDVMGLRVELDEELPPEVRAGFGLEGSSVRVVELSCAGYPFGRLRLAQYDPPATERVRPDTAPFDMATDVGPKAIDFYVRDPIGPRFDELVAWGCDARSRPIRWQRAGFESEEVVLFGPDGVPLLIMVGHRHPRLWHRSGFAGDYSEVATTSVIAGDLDRTRQFYGELLGLEAAMDDHMELAEQDQTNQLVGVTADSSMQLLLYLAPGEPSGKYLIVHHRGSRRRRLTGRMHPGMLGVSLFTHLCDDVDEVHRRLAEAGAEVVATPRDVGAHRSMLVRGPNEELFELVERR